MYTTQTPTFRIGDIYMMQFSGTGSEQNGWRPGLVFQNNTGCLFSPNLIVLPLTSSLKKLGQPTHVLVKADEANLKRDSMILCENPERISKSKVGRYITSLSNEVMKRVAEASLLASSAISLLSPADLMAAYGRAVRLNSIR